ncbi:MAG: S4 domain-containing protein, partial [Oscillospiraceae bacterium]
KVSRIIKRRTVANEVCDAARVVVNGRPVKASYTVSPGDIIELSMGSRTVKARVLLVDEKAGKDTAREMYELIEE